MINDAALGISNDTKLHLVPIKDKTHFDSNNLYDFRAKTLGGGIGIEHRLAEKNLNSIILPYTTTVIPKNPKIENTIVEYVDLHLREYLEENNYNVFLSGGVDNEKSAYIFF